MPLVGSLVTVLPKGFYSISSDQAPSPADGRGGTRMTFTMTLLPPIGSTVAEIGYTARVEDVDHPEGDRVDRRRPAAEEPEPVDRRGELPGWCRHRGHAHRRCRADRLEPAQAARRRRHAARWPDPAARRCDAAQRRAGWRGRPGCEQAGCRGRRCGERRRPSWPPASSGAKNGSGELADGLGKLADGNKKLADGLQQLDRRPRPGLRLAGPGLRPRSDQRRPATAGGRRGPARRLRRICRRCAPASTTRIGAGWRRATRRPAPGARSRSRRPEQPGCTLSNPTSPTNPCGVKEALAGAERRADHDQGRTRPGRGQGCQRRPARSPTRRTRRTRAA